MKEFKKKDKNNFWSSPLFIIILLGLLIFSVFKIIVLIQKERETAHKKELILDEIDALRERERILNEDIAKMKTEEGIEDAIREKYQVVKEGEKMVTIVDEKEKLPLVDESQTDHSFWGWVKSLFNKN